MRDKNIFNRIEKWFQKKEWVISVGLIILGILWLSPLKNKITDILLQDDIQKDPLHINFLIGSVSIVLGIIVSIVHRIGKQTIELTNQLEELKHNIDINFLHYGTNGIYKDVDKEVREQLSRGENVEISILAYTLFSVSPKFAEWKAYDVLRNIKFNLYYLDEKFIKSSPHIDPTWADELRLNIERLKKFREKHKAYLEKKKVEINLYPYHHIPAIHGFKLSTGSIYISSAAWDEDGYIMAPYNTVYEKIEINDKTQHAKHLRKIFNNWIHAASESDKRHNSNDIIQTNPAML